MDYLQPASWGSGLGQPANWRSGLIMFRDSEHILFHIFIPILIMGCRGGGAIGGTPVGWRRPYKRSPYKEVAIRTSRPEKYCSLFVVSNMSRLHLELHILFLCSSILLAHQTLGGRVHQTIHQEVKAKQWCPPR